MTQVKSMQDRHRRVLALSTASILVAALGCETEALDLGSTSLDAAQAGDGGGIIDAASSVSDAAVDAGVLLDRNLVLDGESCTVVGEWLQLVESANRNFEITAACATLGRVRVRLTYPYAGSFPQHCGGVVKVLLGIDTNADPPTLDHAADGLLGNCALMSAPSAGSPGDAIRLDSTVVTGPGTRRHLIYGDAEFVRNGGAGGAMRTVHLSAGPGRVAPEACGLDAGQCDRDRDCPGGVPCLCSGVGVCMTASNCSTNGDCASGQRCALSAQGATGGQWPFGYFCTSPSDDCICEVPVGANDGDMTCAFDATREHWACHERR